MRLLRSLSNDAGVNSELEHRLLSEAGDDVLLFYINSPSVIIGRNQSAEAEVDLAFCAAHGIEVVRRVSGGGAVYHDRGNINYAFITGKGRLSLLDRDPAKPVTEALASLGVEARVGSRRELTLNGFKISGTAAYSGRGRELFHGTLLHSVDLEMMSGALNGDASKRGRHIASVPGRVMNLAGIKGVECDAELFLSKLIRFFEERYGCRCCYI